MEIARLSLGDRIEEKCRCCICLELPDPETAVCHGACGHVFCSSCLSTAISALPECPFCRRPMRTLPGNIKAENHIVYCLIAELPTECPSKPNGCSWKGERLRLASHLSECPYVIVECAFGCGRTIIRNDVYQHISECPRNSFPCEYCGTTLAARDLRSHKEKCAACTRPCPFQTLGCDWRGRRSELIQHLDNKDDYHQRLVKNRDKGADVKEEPLNPDMNFMRNLNVLAKVEDNQREEVKSVIIKDVAPKPKEKARSNPPCKKKKATGKCPKGHRTQAAKMLRPSTCSKCGNCNGMAEGGSWYCIKCDAYFCNDCTC